MRRRDDNKERIHGPYPHRNRWRVHLVAANGARRYRSFETEREAHEYLFAWREETDTRRISEAIDEYLTHLRRIQRPDTTVSTADYRLRSLLRVEERDRSLRSLTPSVARQLFFRRVDETSAETQVGELSCARVFAAWCIERGWMRVNPFVGLKPQGARSRGKPQLRIDEARRFVATAIGEQSNEGLACTLALLMGLRASEIAKRVVRDVDDGARSLWISGAKTKKGDRHLEIPELLRARLAALTAGRDGGERLFGDVDRHWVGYHVRRLCKAAGVPVVCPHGLRGTWASMATRRVPVDQVADALGHESADITRRHYMDASAEADGQQRAVLRVLTGGA